MIDHKTELCKNELFLKENKVFLDCDIEHNIINFIYTLPFDDVEKTTNFHPCVRTFAMGFKVADDDEKENYMRFHRIIKKMQDVILSSYIIATHQKLEDDDCFEQRPVKFILRQEPKIICHKNTNGDDDVIIVQARFGATKFIPEEENHNA